MRILEVRDGSIKLESDEKLALSSFLEVSDRGKKYIAQVIQSRRFEDKCLSFAKMLFSYDGTFNALDGTSPSVDATVVNFPIDLVVESFSAVGSINIGKFASTEASIAVPAESFNRKTLISIDDKNSLNRLLINIANEFLGKRKVLLIDMLGIVESSAKFKAGADFKLPLNTESLEFMYEDCLNDATSDSKSLIKEIFNDLSEYAKCVEFLPFGALKTIVDDMVEKSHVFKLLVLKNKLAKFAKAGYFATSIDEVKNIQKVLSLQNSVVDLSSLDAIFQNRYLHILCNLLIRNNYDGQVFIIASNAITKRNIKTLISTPQIASTFVTSSRFKYLAEFKSLFTNYLIEPNFANNGIFRDYTNILNSMEKNSHLLIGESTNFIPMVLEFDSNIVTSPFDEVIEIEDSSEEIYAVHSQVDEVKDANIEAIEKKSEVFIEKLAEEAVDNRESSELLTIFDDNDVAEEDLVENIQDSEVVLDENLENKDLAEEEPLSESELSKSFEQETDFHTVIDDTQILEVSEEIIEVANEGEELSTEVEIQIPEEIAEFSDEIPEESVGTNVNIEISENQDFSEELSLDEEEISTVIEDSVEEYIETEVTPLAEDEELEEIIELDPDDYGEDDLVVELDDPAEEALNREIIEDVDKVFTTRKEEELSESDLDFIDELNNDENIDVNSDDDIESFEELEMLNEHEELEEYVEEDTEVEFLEPLEEVGGEQELEEQNDKEILETRTSSTPIVPVYDAEIPPEDLVVSDPIEQGDTVIHAKYGTGVVEKMIKYGAKTLFSINFDNVGRRLLDPSLTEIKKA